jgi:hypothetical protein
MDRKLRYTMIQDIQRGATTRKPKIRFCLTDHLSPEQIKPNVPKFAQDLLLSPKTPIQASLPKKTEMI